MFHWICPECGREIPPAVTECPACDPKREQSAAAVTSVVAAVPAPAPAAPPAAQKAVSAAAPVLSSAPESKPPAVAAPDVPPDVPIDPLLALAERIRAAQISANEPPAAPPAPAKPAAVEPAVAEPELAPQLSGLAAALGAEAPTLDLIPVPVLAAPAPAPSAERTQPQALLASPLIEAAPSPVGLANPVPAAALATAEAPVALAEPVPAAVPPPLPLATPETPVALAEPIPAAVPPPLPQTIREEQPIEAAAPVALADPVSAPLPPPMVPEQNRPEPVAPAIQPAPIALAEPIPAALPTPVPDQIRQEPVAPLTEVAPVAETPVAPVPAPPPAVVEEITTQEIVEEPPLQTAPPPAALAEAVPPQLHAPIAPPAPPESQVEHLVQPAAPPVPATSDKLPSGAWLKFAPLQDYSAAAVRAIKPAAPEQKIFTPDSGPRITLPGPTLPPQLNKRENLHVVTVLGASSKRRSVPGWLISFLVMAALLAVGVAVVFYLLPASHTTADAKTTTPEAVITPAVEAAHPLSQSIEVTGIRFVMDVAKKSEIHYLVVNHSGSELSDMTVFVTVRTANSKPGQPPLCRFSFRSTGLGPYESKEMMSSIEKLARPVTLPDWHDLRAEVQIAQ